MDKIVDLQFESVGFRKEFGFQLLKLEDVYRYKSSAIHNPFRPSRIHFFTVIFLTEGEMVHEVDFHAYKMTEGDCLVIGKGQIHKFDPSPTYKGYGLIFTEEFMLRHISPSALSKISFLYNYHLNLLLFKDFSDRDVLIRALTNEFSLDLGSAKVDIIASILTVFLLKVQFQISHGFKPHRANSGKFLQFQKLVATKYMETRKASDYAIMLNMTYKQLNELCKELTKKTTKEYIDNYVVLEAKRLLAISNMSKVPIKKIAYECGFSETTNFLKFFKKIMGVTPAQFKAMRE